ncbi:MAG TPA: trypsin-like peptidase domain-containing protein [Candidatus Eisenbacteria bacterium]|jgi:S1-C subfamily serine protease/DNA-binding response OmpR family regulator|nr:trypsin-like peptidase domain-containing protein [Candidatus Eisenbacteria bacterium]
MKLLLLSLGSETGDAVSQALSGQGYEIIVENGLNVDQVLAIDPEVLVTEASPSDLTCCGLITSLKSRTSMKPLRVLMIVHGEALERARALDLGADDVAPFPFDAAEFAARVRGLFRARQSEDELKTMLKFAVQRENLADLAVETLSSDAVTKRRRWLVPAIFALAAAAVIATVFSFVSARGNRKEALQLKAEIARLNTGLGPQGNLFQLSQQVRNSLEAQTKSDSAARDSLKAQSDDLRKKVAAGGSDTGSLRQQLAETQNRLKLLENEGKVAETIVHSYGPSVCLLHVVVEFLDRDSGKSIQIAVNSLGKPIVDENGMVQLDAGGPGPHLKIDVFGTGFLVRRDGRIVTNHHVAEPWWNNDELKELMERGAKPYVLSYRAYFPGDSEGLPAKLGKISDGADVATLQLENPPPKKASILELDARTDATVTGEPVVLIGYPTGIEGILARAGSDVAQKIAENSNDAQNVSRIMSQLASQQLIRPTTTQGHIGDVLQDKIVYDAATTSGGSGGPLFNRSGKVIGVNFAILRGFGGSNLAVPVRYANELLK